MLGAIIGDIIGSVFEKENTKSTDFELFSRFSRFTDDSVLTVAVADAVMNRESHSCRFIDTGQAKNSYASRLRYYGRQYPQAGYGQLFDKWLYRSSIRGYGSYGNGSAMRVSPIGFALESLEDVLREAKLSAVVTHNHREGIKGAQAIAGAIFLAKSGENKTTIRDFIERHFSYDLSQSLDEIRPVYTFDSTCQGSVPPAIIAFLESTDYEDAIRKAISLGGDSDTIACMTGGIAQAFYKDIPEWIQRATYMRLDANLRRVIKEFNHRYNITV